jgi:NAD(P)-dependent dehydrogenase (short-subunit alcohol dehydrogenase family)
MTGLLDLSGKTVVLTGGASGIGEATAALLLAAGAEVHAVDIVPLPQPVAGVYGCDLGDVDAIDDTVALLPPRLDALINCAGVASGGNFDAEAVMRINWLGLRHLTETLIPRIPRGGSVVHVASTAGRHWPDRVTDLRELMAHGTFGRGLDWVRSNPEACGDGYSFSKEAVQYYTVVRAAELLREGIRMNSVCPGVTNTRLVEDFRRGLGDEVLDRAIDVAGRMAEPAEMAPALLFLADAASASYITGVNLNIDGGTGAVRAVDGMSRPD